MMKFPRAMLCLSLFLFAAAPLGAAEGASDAHVFEFDYDNPIEAPVLTQPEEAAAIPMEAEKSIVIPPPPPAETMAAGEPAFTPPPPVSTAQETPAPDELEALFSPPAEEKVEPAAVLAPAPTVAPGVPPAPEKIQVTRSTDKQAPRAAQAKSQAKNAAPRATAAAKKAEAPFIRDPRFRQWVLASLTWNKPRVGYSYGGAETINNRQPLDLKLFPKRS